MNRKDWEAQVYASNLNPRARLVALVVGSFGNWKDNRNVWPSITAVANMTGLSRDTVKDYVEALEQQGWLRFIRKQPKNVSEYELTRPVAEPIGILAKTTRKVSKAQLSNLSATKTEAVAETKGGQLPKISEAVAENKEAVAETVCTNLNKNLNKEHKEEPKEEDSAQGAREDQDNFIKENDDSPYSSLEDSGAATPRGEVVQIFSNDTLSISLVEEAACSTPNNRQWAPALRFDLIKEWERSWRDHYDRDRYDKARDYILDPTWQSKEKNTMTRVMLALEEVGLEEPW